jgi:CSLREA domain-containing protein
MSRPSLVPLSLAAIGLLVAAVAPVAAAAPALAQNVSVSVPRSATPGRLTTVTVKLPASVAAVDGRLLVAAGTAELIGVAPVGGGSGLRPEQVKGGYAFGAYNLRPTAGSTIVRLVVNPLTAGHLQLRVQIDSTADRAGSRLGFAGDHLASVGVSGASRILSAPSAAAVPQFQSSRAATPVRKLIGFGKVSSQDVDAVRLSWDEARAQDAVCGASLYGDVNDDGCVDIVDLQAVNAAVGRPAATISAARPAAVTTAASATYVVNTSGDRADANVGDGVCSDSRGSCSLRAAIQEADWLAGDDRIVFNIPGSAPALIQLSGPLPIITSKKGTLVIDGYTQPGSRVNDAAVNSNAIMGIEVRGNGQNAQEAAFRITSFGNVIRGVAISNVWRGIRIDGVNAHDNQIIGNWIGFTGNGSNSGGRYGVLLNTGANKNVIGTPALADRNLIGNWTAGIDHYGPGTDGNVTQNNLLCIRPNGQTAPCYTGIDHNFGPKNGLIGGDDPSQRNVIGPTFYQAVEYSHGWNPNLKWGTDTATTYQINNNQLVGNWLGFRADGSYDKDYRSGLTGGGDNGQAVNVYDGSNDNLIRNNFIASAQDGVQSMAPNAKRNEFRNNTIGVSPLGQAAPMSGWGVRLRWGAQYDIVNGNIIRNAASGGVGLTQNTVYNIRITQNIISDTNGPAIYLAPNPNNPSKGANALLRPPVITEANTAQVKGSGIVGATVEVYQASRPAGNNNKGLPSAYLGSAVVNASGNWTVPLTGVTPTLVAGNTVTALQIRTDQNTSDLSVNVTVVNSGPIDPRIAADDFERTSPSGWGSANVGGVWTVTNDASSYTVSGGAGRMQVATGNVSDASLSLDVPAANLTLTGRVNFDRVPSAGNVCAYVDARRAGNTAYRATIREGKSGLVYVELRKSLAGTESSIAPAVSTGITATAATQFAYRFTLVGSHLQLRVWDASGAEPATWQVEADDTSITAAGNVALRAYAGTVVANGPVIVSFDDFLANPAP